MKPRAADGPTTTDNLALACVTCSLCKSARQTVWDPDTDQLVPVFNPRRDDWTDHFVWTPSWEIRGRTSIGRATVEALRMNRPIIVAIRRQLAEIEQFPPDIV